MLVAYCRLCRHCRGRLSLVVISFYALSLLFGPCRLSEFTLSGPRYTAGFCDSIVRLVLQGWIVQTLDSAIHLTTHRLANTYYENQLRYPQHWIEIYPAESVIHLLKNGGQVSRMDCKNEAVYFLWRKVNNCCRA